MGEKPGPVEDEVERALASMRAGFLAGANQVAGHVASLREHLADAPHQEREAVRVSIEKVVAAQERLIARMGRLPTASWDRFKAMVSLVKAQQTVLDEISHLVKEHVLPRQLENLAVTPFGAQAAAPSEPPSPGDPRIDAAAGGPPPAHPPAFQRQSPPAADDPPPAFLSGSQRRSAPAADDPPPAYLSAPQRRSRPPPADDEEPRRSLLGRAREWTAANSGLVAMIVAGIVVSLIPRETKLQDVVARVTEMVGAKVEPAPSGADESATAEQHRPPPPAPKAAWSEERVPKLAPDAAEAGDRPGPSTAEPPDRAPTPAPGPATTTGHRPGSKTALEPVAKRAPAPPAAIHEPAKPAPPPAVVHEPAKLAAAPPPVVNDPTKSAANAASEEQFVPVVFTHKDHATVLRALEDLQRLYPKVLIGRKGEVQPVDLGKKGIWHRLVFLPAGPRPDATRLCDQLMAEGYDRCWVKSH